MKTLKKLRFAAKAFITILLGNSHIYADKGHYSFVGNFEEMENYLKCVANAYNEEARQLEVLQEAKRILEVVR